MMNRIHVVHFVGVLTAVIGMTGCTGLNQLASTIDMRISHVAESGQPEYEGRLDSIQKVGSLTAIKFAGNGPMYDVAEAPDGLVHGDIVRIYKTKAGFTAHLWRRPEIPTISDYPQPQSPTASGS